LSLCLIQRSSGLSEIQDAGQSPFVTPLHKCDAVLVILETLKGNLYPSFKGLDLQIETDGLSHKALGKGQPIFFLLQELCA